MTAPRPILASSSRTGHEYGPQDRPDSGAEDLDKDMNPAPPDSVGTAPRPANRPPRFEAQVGRSSGAPSRRVLVVDDNDLVRTLVARFLARSGYAVEVAADGASAWEMVRTGLFDLLITDQEMPRLTGLELAREVYLARLSLPILLVTASPPERDPGDQAWNQIWATLLKPVAPPELLEPVSSVFQAVPRQTPKNGMRHTMRQVAGVGASTARSGASPARTTLASERPAGTGNRASTPSLLLLPPP